MISRIVTDAVMMHCTSTAMFPISGIAISRNRESWQHTPKYSAPDCLSCSALPEDVGVACMVFPKDGLTRRLAF